VILYEIPFIDLLLFEISNIIQILDELLLIVSAGDPFEHYKLIEKIGVIMQNTVDLSLYTFLFSRLVLQVKNKHLSHT